MRPGIGSEAFFVFFCFFFSKLLLLELFSLIPPIHDPNLQTIIDGYGQLDWNFLTLEAYELIKNTIEHLMYNKEENWIGEMIPERREYVLQVNLSLILVKKKQKKHFFLLNYLRK